MLFKGWRNEWWLPRNTALFKFQSTYTPVIIQAPLIFFKSSILVQVREDPLLFWVIKQSLCLQGFILLHIVQILYKLASWLSLIPRYWLSCPFFSVILYSRILLLYCCFNPFPKFFRTILNFIIHEGKRLLRFRAWIAGFKLRQKTIFAIPLGKFCLLLGRRWNQTSWSLQITILLHFVSHLRLLFRD